METWATSVPSAKPLGSCSELGLLNRVPRLAVINAAGADTFYKLYELGLRWNQGKPDLTKSSTYFGKLDASLARASTIASAIEINRPVSLHKALRRWSVATAWSAKSPIRRSSTLKPKSAQEGWDASPPRRPASRAAANCDKKASSAPTSALFAF